MTDAVFIQLYCIAVEQLFKLCPANLAETEFAIYPAAHRRNIEHFNVISKAQFYNFFFAMSRNVADGKDEMRCFSFCEQFLEFFLAAINFNSFQELAMLI